MKSVRLLFVNVKYYMTSGRSWKSLVSNKRGINQASCLQVKLPHSNWLRQKENSLPIARSTGMTGTRTLWYHLKCILSEREKITACDGWIFVSQNSIFCFWKIISPYSQVALVVNNPPASAGDVRDTGSIPGSGRSPGEGNGNHSPVFLPGESHGQRSMVGYSPWSHKESDMTKQLTLLHF